jgi:hypothetical protein
MSISLIFPKNALKICLKLCFLTTRLSGLCLKDVNQLLCLSTQAQEQTHQYTFEILVRVFLYRKQVP